MVTTTVHSKAQLKAALATSANSILVNDPALCRQLNAVRAMKQGGPWVLAAVLAAIPLVPVTGGTSLKVALASIAAKTGVPISALVAIGGAIMLSILTDWKIIQIGTWVRLER